MQAKHKLLALVTHIQITNANFLILGPLIGDCVDDQFSISGGTGRSTPTICGTNTGYHSKCLIVILRS